MQLDLLAGQKARDNGIDQVSSNNEWFLQTMRDVAAQICMARGTTTADDLRAYAEVNGIEPTHPNAWGAVFKNKMFVSCGMRPSEQVARHGNMIRVWRLRDER